MSKSLLSIGLLSMLCAFNTVTATTTTWQGWNFELGSTGSMLTQIFPDANNITQVEITVDVARVNIGNDGGSLNVRAYHLHDQNGGKTVTWPGPILYLMPGGYLNFTLHNNLGPNPVNDSNHNDYRIVNSTNLHTHGLHADPAVDSIFRIASPEGGSINFYLPIVADHMMGTHWYHAHKHGAATMQLMSGLIGGLVVLPSDSLKNSNTLPADLAEMPEEVVLMQPLKFTSDTTTTACDAMFQTIPASEEGKTTDLFRLFSFEELEAATQSGFQVDYVKGTDSSQPDDFMVVNGHYQPTITFDFSKSTSRLFRFVHAAVGLTPSLFFDTTNGGGFCNMTTVAGDGVYQNTPKNTTTVRFVAGRRFDVVIDCSNIDSDMTGASALKVNYEVQDAKFTGQTLFKIEIVNTTSRISATKTQGYVAGPNWGSIYRPYYLQDLRNTSATSTHSVHMRPSLTNACEFEMGEGTACGQVAAAPAARRQRGGGGGPGGGAAGGGAAGGGQQNDCPSIHFDGERGTTDADITKYSHVVNLGSVEEWQVRGVTGFVTHHPIHIHVNHFQIVGYSGDYQDMLDYNLEYHEFYDTLPALAGDFWIRWKTHTYPGETIFHCHEIAHEDRGLMSSYLVRPAGAAVTSVTSTTTAAAGGATATTTTVATGNNGSPTTAGAGVTAAASSTTTGGAAGETSTSSTADSGVTFEDLSISSSGGSYSAPTSSSMIMIVVMYICITTVVSFM